MATVRAFLGVAALAACSHAARFTDLCDSSIDARMHGRYDMATDAARVKARDDADRECVDDCSYNSGSKACLEDEFLKADTGDVDAQRMSYQICEGDDSYGIDTAECEWFRAHPDRYPAGAKAFQAWQAGEHVPSSTAAPDTTTVPDTTTAPDTTTVPDTRTAPDTTTTTSNQAPDTVAVETEMQTLRNADAADGWTVQASASRPVWPEHPIESVPVPVPFGYEVAFAGIADSSCNGLAAEMTSPSGIDEQIPSKTIDGLQVVLDDLTNDHEGAQTEELTVTLSATSTCAAELLIETRPIPSGQ